MERQKVNAEVVFANLETNPDAEQQRKKEKNFCNPKTMIYNALGLALVLLSAIVFQIIFSDSGEKKEEVVLDWDVEKDRRNFVVTFSYIGCAISLLIFVISSLSKESGVPSHSLRQSGHT